MNNKTNKMMEENFMRKNYVAPSMSQTKIDDVCVLLASGVAWEVGGDGQLVPDIFGGTIS